MRVDDIREAQRAVPFRPFIVHIADGRQFLVDHPEFIFVGRTGRTIVIDDIDGNIRILDPMLVTGLTVPARQESSSG